MGCCSLLIPGATLLPAVHGYRIGGVRRKDVNLCSTPFPRLKKDGRRYHTKSHPSLSCKCQLVDLAPPTAVTYGALLLSGVNKSRSKGSLFGGLTGAALMAAAYFLMQRQETKAVGDALGFGSAFLFSSVFGIRLAASRKLIPAGPLLGLSIWASAVFISSYFQYSL